MNFPYRVQRTAHGRGLVATQNICKGTLIHSCNTPYASVIQRDFRKEVCGLCFAYSFDIGRNTWKVRSVASNGIWFCGEACRDVWDAQENFDGIIGLTYSAIEKAITKIKRHQPNQSRDAHTHHGISRTELDGLWKNAELFKRKCTEVVHLNDTEVDIARWVASAIARRYAEDSLPSETTIKNHHRWSGYLDLQDNELLHIRARPYILDSHMRIYWFLQDMLPPVLQVYVVSSETVRATLARVSGNAFGIWQLSPTNDAGEMFGWGVYVSGAYFNHNCNPNVLQMRVGRARNFYAARDIEEGEELCISYVSSEDDVEERRRALRENWYFHCACKRCQDDSDAGNGEGRSDVIETTP